MVREMKKLFFIISFLILAVVSFGAETGTANGNLPVKATVVDTLGVATNEGVDFGTIIVPRDTSKNHEKSGLIKIVGRTPNSGGMLKLKFLKLQVQNQKTKEWIEYDSPTQEFEVELENKENGGKMTALLNLKAGKKFLGGLTFNEKKEIEVTGKIPKISPTQPEGNYTGVLVVKVIPLIK